jgi:hypothetical protein
MPPIPAPPIGFSKLAGGKRYHDGGGIDEVNIIAQLGEFMVQRSAVDHYGVDTMAAINSLRVPREQIKLHDGGPVGPFGGGQGGPGALGANVHVFSYTDMESLRQAVVNSDANKKFIVNTVTGQAHEVGLGG